MGPGLALFPNDGSDDEEARVKVKVTFEMSARESVQYPGEASPCATFI